MARGLERGANFCWQNGNLLRDMCIGGDERKSNTADNNGKSSEAIGC